MSTKKTRYMVAFVLRADEARKIIPLRRRLCKATYSTQAMQAPIHFSLTKTTEIKNYTLFEKELKKFCKNLSPQILDVRSYSLIIPERFWSGIDILKTPTLINLHYGLEKLINRYAVQKKKMIFNPHITLTYPAKVEGLAKVKIPIKKLNMNRLTILKQDKIAGPYRIIKNIKLNN